MAVRSEDALDFQACAAWLRTQIPDPGVLSNVHQFKGGASNVTYLLTFTERQIVLRRPPTGRKAASAHDMGREFRVQRQLAPVFPAVPQMLALCEDPTILGMPCYAMEYVPGTILRAGPPQPDASAHAQEQSQKHADLAYAAFDCLAQLHAVDAEQAGLMELWKGPGYVARQVRGWSERYRAARTDDVPDGESVMTWLDATQPPDCGAVVVHGDWRLDNLVLDPADPCRIRAVLDWEMSTIGDPLLDLAAGLAYWVQADDDEDFRAFRLQPSDLPGMPTRQQLVDRYLATTQRQLPVDWTFYEVFGLFRLAVIAQQIWYRYRNGQTTNPAFAVFGPAVQTLLTRSARLVG
jgi:aminoglycoside phosphotransferase (APT) family kinase protein